MAQINYLPFSTGGSPCRHRIERFYESREHRSSDPNRFAGWLQHRLNALHVMVLFVGWGMPRPKALAVARRWERLSHRWLYPGVR